MLIAVDLGQGQPVAIGQVDEANPQAVRRFLEPLVQRLGVCDRERRFEYISECG